MVNAWTTLGNHECEFGTDTIAGKPGGAPGGIGAQGAAGNYWNGPYGFGHYLSRFLLPDNGVTNWDGNRLSAATTPGRTAPSPRPTPGRPREPPSTPGALLR